MNNAPDPKDVQEFLFKQFSTRRICDNQVTVSPACSLLAADGKRGLLYVAYDNKITVLKGGSHSELEQKVEHVLPNTICKISLSCDCNYIAVTLLRPAAFIYNASSFVKKDLVLLHEIRLSSSNEDVIVFDLRWNPCISGMLCTVASDHTVGSVHVKGDQKPTVGITALEKLHGLEALCAAWSPKGKQIVIGCKSGNIVQLKPELKIVRTISGPVPNIGGIIAILWISNYQFCAAFLDPNDLRINVLIIDAPKGETTAKFTCYEDITYGLPEIDNGGSSPRYYFDYVAEWGLIIAASSNSSEIAILGSPNGGLLWEQWYLVDSGRAQLPLIRTSESYPVGISVDRSSTQKLPWGTDSTLPNAVPVLHIFSTSGQLCSFHMVNLTQNCPAICSPPIEAVSLPEHLEITNSIPSEISFNINSGSTSTPRPKQADVIERPKTVPNVNLFGSNIKNTAPPPPPITIPEVKPLQPRIEKTETPQLPEVKPPPVKEVTQSEKPLIDYSICIRAYEEEQIQFEKELSSRLETQVFEIGNDNERKQLGEVSVVMDQFLKDLRETTDSLATDIAYLKALLLQSFAWLEETKSKEVANVNESNQRRSDNAKLLELQRLFYYTQSQLAQATKALDMEWAEHENHTKLKMKMPSLEFVYQTLLRHSQIIAKQRNIIQQQTRKWKSIERGNNVSELNRSMGNLQLTLPSAATDFTSKGGVIDLRCRAIASKTRSFSQEKQKKLRSLLSNLVPTTIKAIDPSPVQDRLEATLSSLASLSPVSMETKNKSTRSSIEQKSLRERLEEKTINEQSPLASLNNIVGRIGMPTMNDTSIQARTQIKVPSVISTPAFANKMVQPNETKPSIGISPLAVQSKSKQNTGILFGHHSTPSTQAPILAQAGTNIGALNFTVPPQKPGERSSHMLKEILKNEAKTSSASSKPEISFTSQMASKNIVVPSVEQITKTPAHPTTIVSAPPSKPQTSFSFANATSLNTIMKSPTMKNIISATASSSVEVPTVMKLKEYTSTISASVKTDQPSGKSPAQEALNLSGLSLGLQSPGVTMPHPNNASGDAKPIGSPEASTGQMAVKMTTPPTQVFGTNFGSPQTSTGVPSPPVSKIVFNVPSNNSPTNNFLANRLFDGTAAPATSFFGNTSPQVVTPPQGYQNTATTSSTSVPFGGIGTVSSGAPTFNVGSISISNASAFSGSPTAGTANKPTFGQGSVFGDLLNSTSSALNFGTATSIAPAFGKADPSLSTTSLFGAALKTPTTTSVFGQTTTSSPSNVFGTVSGGASSNAPVFGTTPTTSANVSIFGGTSASTTTGSVFAANPTTTTTSSLIFGGNTYTTTAFGTPAGTPSVFGASPPKSTTSVFGAPAQGSPTMVSGGPAGTPVIPAGGEASIVQGATSTFGQASTFGAKPVFGTQAPVFGAAKSTFGSTAFGGNVFGGGSTASSFGGPPAMGTSTSPLGGNNMPNVFGATTGSTTFESLAGQSGGLTFGSLAQKTTEPEKPQFSGGSSFSSWR
ncbi:nuclear pore complex protein Nup214 [Orussus abietinus]|uniref:nuclear pore complex protein Nup214 n=1 Tax=Orussus abietinus TaxID=222816 RepID=UPI000625D867|nr:nuclear pore complex protein Nup214 [Orussus abietinus]